MYGITLKSCTLTGNTAASGGNGGGLYTNSYAGVLAVEDCTFTLNQAASQPGFLSGPQGGLGSGMCVLLDLESHISACLVDCNGDLTSTAAGGGIYSKSPKNFPITDCTITHNAAQHGGGVAAADIAGASTTFNRCTIDSNKALIMGGGIESSRYLSIEDSTVSNNTVVGSASAHEDGGGIAMNASTVTLSTLIVTTCTMSGNVANDDGGGISLNGVGTVAIEHSTIAYNTATGSGGGLGGGVYNAGSQSVTLDQTIIGKNSGSALAPDISDQTGNLHVTYCLTSDTNGYTPDASSGNNLEGYDPRLASLAFNGGPTKTHKPIYISPTDYSPAIDNGIMTFAVPTGSHDQRGYSRLVDVPPFSPITDPLREDIGAYEVQLPPTVSSVEINHGVVQRSRVTSVIVHFDSLVTFPSTAAGAFQLQRQSDGKNVGLTAVVSDSTSTSVELTFNGALSDYGSLQDGRYTLTALAANITSPDFTLDGNMDYTPGDDYVLASAAAATPFVPPTNIFRLFGDYDGSGKVDSLDFSVFRSHFMSALPPTPYGDYDYASDFNDDSKVDSIDFTAFLNRFNTAV